MKKIAVITATRAEYGLFKSILHEIDNDPDLQYHLIVTGMHMNKDFGSTGMIVKDEFQVHNKISFDINDDTGAGMAKNIGKLMTALAHDFETSKPDILLLLGDRGEMLVGAIAASCMNIAILHLHGGEESGSVDNHFRKSITKLAHLHLAATEESKQNLIALGEKPEHIQVVGAPGLDNIAKGLASPEEIARSLIFDPEKPIALLVQHPVISEVEEAAAQMKTTLDAIVETGIQTLIIYPNADPGGRAMIKVIEEYLDTHDYLKGEKSLPREKYLAVMNAASLMLGNSSSGIIEAMSFNLPVINIGTRQHGRQRAVNTLDAPHNKEFIKSAIDKALNDVDFHEVIRQGQNPYGDGNTTSRIITIIKQIKIDKKFLQKRSE